jgi:hypothetical protein
MVGWICREKARGGLLQGRTNGQRAEQTISDGFQKVWRLSVHETETLVVEKSAILTANKWLCETVSSQQNLFKTTILGQSL